MWYFTWMLGLGFACAFAILNALWLDLDHEFGHDFRPLGEGDGRLVPAARRTAAPRRPL
jgi:cyd operon protein YbgT